MQFLSKSTKRKTHHILSPCPCREAENEKRQRDLLISMPCIFLNVKLKTCSTLPCPYHLSILCFEQNDGSQVVYTFLPNFCILPFSVQLCKQFHRFLAEHLPALDTDFIRSCAAAFLTRNTQQGCALPDRGADQNTANRRNQNGCSGPFPAAGLLMNGQQGR